MDFMRRFSMGLRRWWHKREIESALRYYGRRTGRDARKRQAYSESGSFQSQLHRLFGLGTAEETGELETIATAVVNACLSNKYYRPADLLSDFIDALEGRTYLSMEVDGEAPLEELDGHRRKLKIERVMRSWLVPVKVAAVESVLAEATQVKDRFLPYPALGRLERQAARLFGLVEESEVLFVEERILEFLREWRLGGALRQRYAEPATGLEEVVRCLTGEKKPPGIERLRLRRAGAPIRLSTVVPEERQHLLRAALECLQLG